MAHLMRSTTGIENIVESIFSEYEADQVDGFDDEAALLVSPVPIQRSAAASQESGTIISFLSKPGLSAKERPITEPTAARGISSVAPSRPWGFTRQSAWQPQPCERISENGQHWRRYARGLAWFALFVFVVMQFWRSGPSQHKPQQQVSSKPTLTTKAIQDIKIGDLVWAADPETGEMGARRVTETYVNQAHELIVLNVRNADGSTGELKTTPEHPFWVRQKGWIPAGELQAQDTLIGTLGEVSGVVSVVVEPLEKPLAVYNFQVDGLHTYFVVPKNATETTKVIEQGVLVHNDCDKKTSRAARREAMREEGIPTSQQPISQSKNASGREYSYDTPKPGGGTQTKSVQQQTIDRSHPGQSHWEAGTVKIDPVSGKPIMNNYGRPRLTTDKTKVDYDN